MVLAQSSPLLEDGAVCTRNEECQSGNCCAGPTCDPRNVCAPSISQPPTPTPYTPATTPPPEEDAVYDLNQGLKPPGTNPEVPEDTDIFRTIFQRIEVIFSTLFWWTEFHDKQKLSAQSEAIQQSEVPPELKPDGSNPEVNIKVHLGGSAGTYGNSLPDFDPTQGDCGVENPQEEIIKFSECMYEQANFPPGVHPITGRR